MYRFLLFIILILIRSQTPLGAENKPSKLYVHKLTAETVLPPGTENRFRNGIINSVLRNFEGKYTVVDDESMTILYKRAEALQRMNCSDEICMKQIADAIEADEVISGTISTGNGLIRVSLRNQTRDSKTLAYTIKSAFQMEFPEFLLDYYAGESGRKLLDRQYDLDLNKAPVSANGNLNIAFLKIKPVPGTNLNSMEFKTSDRILEGILEEVREELDEASRLTVSKEYENSTKKYERILTAFSERLSEESLRKLNPFVREIQTSVINNYNLEYKEKINLLDRSLFESDPNSTSDMERVLKDYAVLTEEYANRVPEKYKQIQISQSLQERKEKVELALFSLKEKEADKAYAGFDFSLAVKLYRNLMDKASLKSGKEYGNIKETLDKKADTAEKTGRSHLTNRLETLYLRIEKEFTAEALAESDTEKEEHRTSIQDAFREGMIALAKSEFSTVTQIDRIKKEIKRIGSKLNETISFQEYVDELLHEGLENKNPTQILNSHRLGADWNSKSGLFWGSAKSKLRELMETAVSKTSSNREFQKLFAIHFLEGTAGTGSQEISDKPSSARVALPSSSQSPSPSSYATEEISTKLFAEKRKNKKFYSLPSEKSWISPDGSYNWHQARQICSSMDLRLPTIEELEDSYESGETESWISEEEKRFWSSTISIGQNGAYNLDVFKGEIRWDHLGNYAGVRCLK
ncbi:cag pathogenicity island protein CagA [Leptospira gomenensis]|uniref:Cag pathogenicity island protein CagA n=1 Tax=Leptospira gomenensis TaxID=2484974 RepID=A0A5F1YDW8_9LEPT|nr:cag pathogenicity island protein CagA [Leptospira gomenensis]TGK36390.1 cag pathogenicity island protein CagA [Leptospira gomenensis]TGK43404.1 cag pathogenicity island protein CagA [Leptospira gomenensis]TGK44407.1 cag pathogenicity island protein CagA [Leptospira gomenensis]TGK67531.1 cag pathogenicity island protein CagA [Leptospira gomenensis]